LAAEHAIISPRDVGNIRRYVRMKYAELPQERHAEIVADAVSRTIFRQLPEFEETERKRLAAELIRSTVVREKRPVTAVDVLEASMKLDWREPEKLRAIARWADRRLAADLQEDRIVELLEAHATEAATAGAGDSTADLWARLQAAAAASRAEAAGALAPGYRAPVVPLNAPTSPIWRRSRKQSLLYGLLSCMIAAAMLGYGWQQARERAEQDRLAAEAAVAADAAMSAAQAAAAANAVSQVPGNELPATHRYTDIDADKLTAFLESRGSLLRLEPYRSAIMDAAKQFDIHPLLLFAITGQEQGFVHEEHERAKEIANNPFNVYHSWQDFNTTIDHSAAIASRTIIRLSRDRPAGRDPVAWINREYAEDPKWHVGVNKLFETMKDSIE